MRHAVRFKNGKPAPAPRFGLVKVKSQTRRRNPETGRKRWVNNDPAPEPVRLPVTKFARGDRFGRGQDDRPALSATEEWRGKRRPV
jgi:hypothetical protein